MDRSIHRAGAAGAVMDFTLGALGVFGVFLALLYFAGADPPREELNVRIDAPSTAEPVGPFKSVQYP